MVAIVKDKLHHRAAGGFAVIRTRKNQFTHALAAQITCLAFTQRPAHGFNHIGFAAAVRPHDPDNGRGHFDGGEISKGLKAADANLAQTHELNLLNKLKRPLILKKKEAPCPGACFCRKLLRFSFGGGRDRSQETDPGE